MTAQFVATWRSCTSWGGSCSKIKIILTFQVSLELVWKTHILFKWKSKCNFIYECVKQIQQTTRNNHLLEIYHKHIVACRGMCASADVVYVRPIIVCVCACQNGHCLILCLMFHFRIYSCFHVCVNGSMYYWFPF